MSARLDTLLTLEQRTACAMHDRDYGRPTAHPLDPRNDDEANRDQWLAADLDGMPVSVNWKSAGGCAVVEGFVVGEVTDDDQHFIRSHYVAHTVYLEWLAKAERERQELLEQAHADAQPGRFAA